LDKPVDAVRLLSIAADHPSLPGHFPGQPIVPGVVILDEVLHAIALEHAQWAFYGFRKVKFLRPLLPGQSFSLLYKEARANMLKVSCATGTEPLLEAILLFRVAGACVERAPGAVR